MAEIVKGKIGNALTSTAADHVVAVADDIFDEQLEKYQSVLNSLMAIKDESGEVHENPFRYVANEEYMFAIVDGSDRFLCGIHWDGTPQFAKLETATSQQFKLVNEQIKTLSDKISAIVGDDDTTDIIDTLNEMKRFFADISNTENLSTILELIDKVAIHDGEGNVVECPFSVVDNEEYVKAVVDAEGRLLFGIKSDGKPYFPKNEMYRVESNEEWLAVWLDAAGHVLFGIRLDGSIYVAKSDFLRTIEQIQTLLNASGVDGTDLKGAVTSLQDGLKPLTDTFIFISNEEWLHAIVDADNRLLFGIKAETGEVVIPKQDTYKVESNEEWLAVWLDAAGHVLFGVKADGMFWAAKHNFGEGGNVDDEIEAINETLSTLQGAVASLQDKVSELEDSVGQLQQGNEAMKMLSVIDDVEERTEITLDADGKILGYRDVNGVRHEEKLDVVKLTQRGNEINSETLVTQEDLSDMSLSSMNGVEDHSLPNLFDKSGIRTYDSEFADKVFAAIGNKTGDTGCYSNNIECKEGDWFTRSDFGTGIIVVLDEHENILGNVANAAYQPTVQIKPAKPEFDFSLAKYAVFVVMLANLDSERIVKSRYIPTGEGDYVTIPKLRVLSENIDKDTTTYLKSNSGRYYQLQVDDSGESPILTPVVMEGIPASELPSDFPTFKVSGDFSQYYDGLVFCPIEGGVTEYLYELAPNGLVKRYIKQKVNCPRILKEGDTWYYYGVSGGLNSSSGKLNIYKANGETFELVKGNLGGGDDGSLQIEPHDCLVLSVNPLHYIYQRYVSGQYTTVDGEQKRVTALHVGEIYDGNLLYEWHSEDYPELWVDSHIQGDNADYLHNNTICISADGNLYLNNKQANQIIVLKRTWDDEGHTATIGDILWKIGGNRTHAGWDVPTRIKTTTEQQWYESHDAVINSNGLITMYDNKASGASRILEFNIDTENKQLTNFKAHTWQQYRGRYMGSVDKFEEGIYLVSWGSQRSGNTANTGIYDFNENKILFEIRFDNAGSSAYRVYGIPKGQE